MKVLVYSAKDFEIPFLEKANNERYQIKYIPERLTSKTAMMALGFEVISIFSADDASSLILEKLKDFGVKYIAARSTGYDNINLQMAKKLDIKVANASGYSPQSVAEHAVALLLALNRKLTLADQQVRNYNFSLSNLVGSDLCQKTVGIIGTGRIGKVITKIMHGFGCNLIACDILRDTGFSQNYDLVYTNIEEVCSRSDIIFLSVPLTTETYHMIDDGVIQLMKKNLILINIARGAIVHTGDIINALELKKIAAYGTDVYEGESGIFFYDRSKDKPTDPYLQKLIDLPNVLLTPHQAFATEEALDHIASITFDSIQRWDRGKPSKNELIPTIISIYRNGTPS